MIKEKLTKLNFLLKREAELFCKLLHRCIADGNLSHNFSISFQ